MASDSSLSTFPLLRLPDDAIRETIRIMDVDEIICISLVSKKCKRYVISINMKATSFEVFILGDVNFDIKTSSTEFYLGFPSDEAVMAGQKRKLKTPHCFLFCLYEDVNIIDLGRRKWAHFEYQDWLEHIWDIFHYQGLDQLHLDEDSFLYDLDDIKKVFGAANELFVEHTGNYDFNKLLFKKFSYFENIRFDINVFQDSKIPLDILIQNIEQILIDDLNETSQTIQLNDLLMIYSKSIVIYDLRMSPKNMNKFIKLWIEGAAPQMELLKIKYHTEEIPDENEIMKGIKYIEVSEDQNRRFICCDLEESVTGGMDIQRKNGTRATIRINQFGNRHVFDMFIWHDHCFVKDEIQ